MIRCLIPLLIFLSLPSFAHEGRPVFLEVIHQEATTYLLRWKIPPVLAAADVPSINLVGKECTTQTNLHSPQLIGAALYQCTTAPTAIRLDYPRANPVLSTLLRYQSISGNSISIMAPPSETSVALPVDRAFLDVARTYLISGIDHILEGYDHLLFIVCLMLIAKKPRRVVLTVTGFTIGHSLTLIAASLGVFSVSPSLVEPLIAFSILLLAVEALNNDPATLTQRYPALMAAAFGLLHGLGFAGALSELGLPLDQKVPALLFFNLGVETGQLLFVAVAYLAVQFVRYISRRARQPATINWNSWAGYPAGFVAAYWTIERVYGALV